MQRRSFLKLGIGSAVVLGVAGGAVALMQPGFAAGKLSTGARQVMAAVGQAVLAGTLPADAATRAASVEALLGRIDTLVNNSPTHVQDEISQLLGLLSVGLGRRTLAGLGPDWQEASTAEVSACLQSMRVSSVRLRQQAYQGLHELVCAAYFSGKESWAVLDYPGPLAL